MGPSPEAIEAAEKRIEKFEAWLMQQPDQQYPVFDYVRGEDGNILYFAEDGETILFSEDEDGNRHPTEHCPESPEDIVIAEPKEIRKADQAYPLARPEKAILKTYLLWEALIEPAQTPDSDPDGR